MTEAEMMQRVVAILTQARDLADQYDESSAEDSDEVRPEAEMIGEFVLEAIEPGPVGVRTDRPQDVANAVTAAIQPRVGLLVACFSAAFTQLASRYDESEGDGASAALLRELALQWEMEDGE
ncbi:hypothetical protein ACIRF8_15665 [Streptomyces sp. NPDC102406]|uniref:hypothetical protein n=1 Tax=Streptomyces sp. NPDC102406 TaxID=3366171 RepID=UPI00381F2EEF